VARINGHDVLVEPGSVDLYSSHCFVSLSFGDFFTYIPANVKLKNCFEISSKESRFTSFRELQG
jgi:hypothetical protein